MQEGGGLDANALSKFNRENQEAGITGAAGSYAGSYVARSSQALNKALMRTTNRKMRRKAGKEGPNRGPQMRRTSRDYLS